MVGNHWVNPEKLVDLFTEVRGLLSRFPAVNADELENAVRRLASEAK